MIPNRTVLISVGRAALAGGCALGQCPITPPVPLWLIEETAEAFVSPTPTGRHSHLYFEDEPGRRIATKQLNKDEPRRIAANIAKILALIRGGLRHCSRVDVAMAEGAARGPFHNVRPRC